MGIAVFSNTLSATLVFRASLIQNLAEKQLLAVVCALKQDVTWDPGTQTDDSPFVRNPGTNLSGLIKKDVLLIHSFTHSANLIACIIALLFRKKLVMTVTGMGTLFGAKGVLGVFGKTLVRLFYFLGQFVSQAIIVQNQDDYREIDRLLVSFSKCSIFITAGSGVPKNYFLDVRPKTSLKSSKINVGFFSRALPRKGVWSFFELAAAYAESNQLKFIHVGLPGRGPLRADDISSIARKHNVSYLGYASDLRPWLLATDIVVIPSSYREGVSRLLIESMLAGKMVVAKNTTGVRDHIKDGVNGILYASDSELFMALERALSALNGPIPKNAKAYAELYFDVELVNEVYFDAYRCCGLGV